jgi:hypothetical protein
VNTQANHPSLARRLLGLFIAPRATFQSLAGSITTVDVAVPLFILLALSLGTEVAMRPLMIASREQYVLQNQDIPDEQKDTALERIQSFTESPWSLVWSVLTKLVWYAILAGVVMFFGSFILGGEPPTTSPGMGSFQPALTVVLYAGLFSVVEWAVKLPLMLSLNTLNIQTGVGLFLPRSLDGTLIQRFFSSLDFFVMWKLYLVSIGMALIYRVTERQARTLLFSAWIVAMLLIAWLGTVPGTMPRG